MEVKRPARMGYLTMRDTQNNAIFGQLVIAYELNMGETPFLHRGEKKDVIMERICKNAV